MNSTYSPQPGGFRVKKYCVSAAFAAAAMLVAGTAMAQSQDLKCRDMKVQNFRQTNQCGVNVFEAPKDKEDTYAGFAVDWGAGFTQSFQSLKHSNTADPKVVTGYLVDGNGTSTVAGTVTFSQPGRTVTVDQNKLVVIGKGFNLAGANLNLNAQLAKGVRLELVTYLSSRHHNEAWVKGGYIQMDESPVNLPIIRELWAKYITVKVGHMEIDYGDAHFRRSDNGNGMQNAFIGNYLMDSFAVEIGAEAYIRANGVMAMGGFTSGQIKGDVLNPSRRGLSLLGKAGFDRQVNPDLRVRVTGSMYHNGNAPGLTLYGGDRAGSPYFLVGEYITDAVATVASGQINPGMSRKMTSFVLNPFLKFRGLEVFGVLESASGNNGSATDTVDRTFHQVGGEGIYRFGNDNVYVGARYNTVSGRLAGFTADVTVNRTQLAVGWFMNHYLLAKAEYVKQEYKDYPSNRIQNGLKFSGIIIQGVVGF